jgi:hypothetical protein
MRYEGKDSGFLTPVNSRSEADVATKHLGEGLCVMLVENAPPGRLVKASRDAAERIVLLPSYLPATYLKFHWRFDRH